MPVSDGGKPQLLLPAHCWSVAAWGLLPVLPFGGTWGSLLKAGLRRGAGASPSPPPAPAVPSCSPLLWNENAFFFEWSLGCRLPLFRTLAAELCSDRKKHNYCET